MLPDPPKKTKTKQNGKENEKNPTQPTPPPTAFTEKDRDLKSGMNVHHEGSFGAIEAIFKLPPWALIGEKNP